MFGFELIYNYLDYIFNDEIKNNQIIFYLVDKGLLEYLTNSGIKNIKYLNKKSILNFKENKKYVNSVFNRKLNILKNNLTIWNNYIKVYRFFEKTFLNSSEFKTKKFIRQFPILPWKRYYSGGTNYIDRIRTSNLKYPIMIGVDHFRRPFITIKYTYQELDWADDINKKKIIYSENKIGRITIFQRYTNDYTCWVSCNKRGPIMRFDGNSSFSDSEKKLLIENIICLISGKKTRCFQMPRRHFDAYYYDFNDYNIDGYEFYDCKI